MELEKVLVRLLVTSEVNHQEGEGLFGRIGEKVEQEVLAERIHHLQAAERNVFLKDHRR